MKSFWSFAERTEHAQRWDLKHSWAESASVLDWFDLNNFNSNMREVNIMFSESHQEWQVDWKDFSKMTE